MRISVEAGGFTDAAEACRTGNQTAALLCESLAGKLAGYAAMAGEDTTSAEFAAAYDAGARQALATLAELTHAFIGVGRLLAASGANHRDAETAAAAATSCYTGGRLEDDDYLRVAPAAPPSSLGASPATLGPVQTWILDRVEGFVWPGADVDLLGEAASAWRRAGAAVAELEAHCAIAAGFLDDQVSPEIPLARAGLAELRSLVGETAEAFGDLADSCQEYADAVLATHQRTLDLLAEIGAMVVEGLAISAVAAALTGGLGAGAAGTAAVARITAQAPRFHALLTTWRITASTTTTRLRTTRDTLGVVRTRVEKFTRVPARNERGQIRLPGPSGTRRPGWLRAHEGGVTGGHTLARHVGRTLDELRERLASSELTRASTFGSQEAAERYISRAIDLEGRAIRDWLAGSDDRLRIVCDLGEPTGTTLRRSGEVVHPTGLRIVLDRDPTAPEGWRIKTAFPD